MTANDFLPYYKGTIRSVAVTTTQGINIQFPAMHLRKHMTASGIKGYFCLETQQNKFLSLSKIK